MPLKHAALTVTLSVAVAILPLGGSASGSEPDKDLGRRLFVQSCASCHGVLGQGTEDGPSLREAGEAAVDFQLRTGRMPLDEPDARTLRKPPAFEPTEIDAIVAYVGTFTTGPDVPEVRPEAAPITEGQELFVANCAPCHGATAAGGAVGGRAFAPSLLVADPVEIAEAMITGPGQMPVFAWDEHEINAVVRFIGYLQAKRDPGGLDIGGIGPVTEGFVAWILGAAALTFACVVLARRGKKTAE